MIPNTITDISTASRAEFSGVMVIDTITTTPGKPKTPYIAGAFFSIAGPVMGVFKYFNKYDYVFDPESQWFVNTTVTLFDVAAVSKTGFRVDPEDDFDVMGDIFYISPANDVPAKHPPVVKICGRPINIVTETASFDIDANQWIGFHNQKVLFPWSGTIHEGWMNKPVPNPNSPKFVNVTGILAGVQTVGKLKRFHVDIVGVTFLGAVPAGPSSQMLTPTPRGKRKAGISFEDKSTSTKRARV